MHYTICRYLPDVHSWDYCTKWFRWSAGITTPIEMFAGGILILRTYAFAGKKLYYLVLFVLLYLTMIIYVSLVCLPTHWSRLSKLIILLVLAIIMCRWWSYAQRRSNWSPGLSSVRPKANASLLDTVAISWQPDSGSLHSASQSVSAKLHIT